MKSKNRYACDQIDPYTEKLIQTTAKRLVRRGCFSEDDVECLEQELMLHLLGQLPKHDPRLRTRESFMSMVVERKASNLARNERLRRSRYAHPKPSEDESSDPLDISEEDYRSFEGNDTRSISDSASEAILIDEVLEGVDEPLRLLAELLKTHNIAEIAKITGYAESTIHERRARLRKAFLGHLEKKVKKVPRIFRAGGK